MTAKDKVLKEYRNYKKTTHLIMLKGMVVSFLLAGFAALSASIIFHITNLWFPFLVGLVTGALVTKEFTLPALQKSTEEFSNKLKELRPEYFNELEKTNEHKKT